MTIQFFTITILSPQTFKIVLLSLRPKAFFFKIKVQASSSYSYIRSKYFVLNTDYILFVIVAYFENGERLSDILGFIFIYIRPF